MDETFELQRVHFVWNAAKARRNLAQHGIPFEQAAEAFFDPFLRLVDASEQDEAREENMKAEKLTQRLDRNRPMTTVTIRMPQDVIDDLKRIAPLMGFSGYQPLIRAYVGQALRQDLERFDTDTVSELVSSLKRRGVSPQVIEEALTEVGKK